MLRTLSGLPKTFVRNLSLSSRVLNAPQQPQTAEAPAAHQKSAPSSTAGGEAPPPIIEDDMASDEMAINEAFLDQEEPTMPQQQNFRRIRIKTVNMVHLVGRVGSDPTVRGSETANVVAFSLATNRIGRNAGDKITPIEVTDWHNVIATLPMVKNFAKDVIGKGDLVSVTGSLTYRKINPDPTHERTLSIPQVRADRIQLIMSSRRRQREDYED